jgi:hypothetical protein
VEDAVGVFRMSGRVRWAAVGAAVGLLVAVVGCAGEAEVATEATTEAETEEETGTEAETETGSEEETETEDETKTEARTEEGLSKAAAELVDEFALDQDDCEEVTIEPDAELSVECDVPPVTWELSRFEDAADLQERFAELVGDAGSLPRDWALESDAFTPLGSLVTATEGSRSVVHWTEDDVLVLSRASRPGDVDAVMEWFEAGELVAADPSPIEQLVAGDCVALPEGSTDDPAEVECDNQFVTDAVLSVHLNETDPSCPEESDRTFSTERPTASGVPAAYALCLQSTVAPVADNVLAIGSCVEQRPGADEGTVDVEERPCGDGRVTHEVVATVAEEQPCPPDSPSRISKSDTEVEQSGPGSWCLVER